MLRRITHGSPLRDLRKCVRRTLHPPVNTEYAVVPNGFPPQPVGGVAPVQNESCLWKATRVFDEGAIDPLIANTRAPASPV
jgi:hypothetical protein